MLAVYIFVSIALAVLVGVFTSLAKRALETNGTMSYPDDAIRKKSVSDWLLLVGPAILSGVLYFLCAAHVNNMLSVVCLFVAIALLIAAAVWAVIECTEWREVALFLPLMAALTFTVVVASRAAKIGVAEDAFLASLLTFLPLLVIIVALGAVIMRVAWVRWNQRTDLDATQKLRNKIYFWAALGLSILALVLSLVFSGVAKGIDLSDIKPEDAFGEEVSETLKVEEFTYEDLEALTQTKYANISKTLDDSSLTPHDADRTAKTGFSDALAYPFSEFAEIEESNMRNPSYLKTSCDFFKSKTISGKKIGDLNPWMGEFSSITEEEGVFVWCEWANDAHTVINVTDEYRRYGAMMNTFLERFIQQGVQNRTTIENWCLSSTSLNNERWGVLADYQYTDDFLVLAWVGKNERGKEQATGLFVFGFNVHDRRPAIFGAEPEIVYETGTPLAETGGPGNPGNPGNPGKPDEPDEPDKPDEPEKPVYNKDPSKGIPAKPGEADANTSNLEDPDHSTEDRTDNSTSVNHEQYRDDMDHKAEVNENQKVGGDDNTASTETPADTTVHNNGDKGNGGAGIDTPTSESGSAAEAGTGKAAQDKGAGDDWRDTDPE